MTQSNQATALRVRRASEIDATGEQDLRMNRYLLESPDSGGSVALVEHTLGRRVLAAPVHRHSREDEYSVVLQGQLGVIQDGAEVIANPGDIVFKPRGHWHTFWNAGDGELRVLEVIVPGGIEEAFRRLGKGEYDPRPCLAWSPSTAVRSTSRQPCLWSSDTASSCSFGRARRRCLSGGA